MIKTQTKIPEYMRYEFELYINEETRIKYHTDTVVGQALHRLLFGRIQTDYNDTSYPICYSLVDISNEDERRSARLLLNNLYSYINNLTLGYSYGEYNYIPLYTDEIISNETYEIKLSNIFIRHLMKHIDVLKRATIDGLKFLNANRELVIDTKKGGSDTLQKTYGSIITGDNDNKSMGENAPINSDINVINTPNSKSISINHNESKKTGDDTHLTTYGMNIDDKHTEISPEIYNQFLKILEKYNIPSIIDGCYRKIIHEFNTSI